MGKRLALWAVFGIVFGYALSTFLGMRFTSWFFDPGKGAPLSCTPVIDQAFGKLLEIELWGTVAFFVVFVVLGVLWERGRARKPASPAAPPAR